MVVGNGTEEQGALCALSGANTVTQRLLSPPALKYATTNATNFFHGEPQQLISFCHGMAHTKSRDLSRTMRTTKATKLCGEPGLIFERYYK